MEHSPSCVWFSAKGCCLCSWPPPPHVMPMTLCLHLSVNFLNSRKHRLTTTSTPPSYPPSHELLIFLVPESPTQASAFTWSPATIHEPAAASLSADINTIIKREQTSSSFLSRVSIQHQIWVLSPFSSSKSTTQVAKASQRHAPYLQQASYVLNHNLLSDQQQ